MKDKLFDDIKLTAYFLWECIYNSDNGDTALKLWYCAEDLAFYFQKSAIYSEYSLENILNKGKYSKYYIDFVRNIAFRIYLFTGNDDSEANWYMAEKLLKNTEWKDAIIDAANIYDNINNEKDVIKTIMSENIRKYYEK